MRAKIKFIIETVLVINVFTFSVNQSFAVVNPQTNPAFYLHSDIFDWQVYLAVNPSLVGKGVNTKLKAEQHWLKYGLKSGRQGNSKFSTRVYLSKYQDMQAAFGASPINYVGLAWHYRSSGKATGRVAIPMQREYAGVLPTNPLYPNGGDAVVGNHLIKIVTSSRFAGAVAELYYGENSEQIVDDGAMTYGRLFQVAVWKYGLGKCFNPIEAGSRYYEDRIDSSGSTVPGPRSSVVNGTEVVASFPANVSLSTSITPALFRRYGDDDCEAGGRDSSGVLHSQSFVNRLPSFSPKQVRDNTMRIEKSISMNAFNDPNIVKIQVRVQTNETITVHGGNAAAFIVQFYAALKHQFEKVYKLDLGCAVEGVAGCTRNPVGYFFNPSDPEPLDRYESNKAYIVEKSKGSPMAFALYATKTNLPPTVVGGEASRKYVSTFRRLGPSDGGGHDIIDTSINFLAKDGLPANTESNPFYKMNFYLIMAPTKAAVAEKIYRLQSLKESDSL